MICISGEKHQCQLCMAYDQDGFTERLHLKQEMGKRVPVRTKEKLRAAANDHMLLIERSPERVKAYFQDPLVKYAAA